MPRLCRKFHLFLAAIISCKCLVINLEKIAIKFCHNASL